MECQYSEGVENMWLKEWPLPIQPHYLAKYNHVEVHSTSCQCLSRSDPQLHAPLVNY